MPRKANDPVVRGADWEDRPLENGKRSIRIQTGLNYQPDPVGRPEEWLPCDCNPTDDRSETAEFAKHDLAFHMLVIEATGNQTMVRSSESSNALMRVFATERHGYDAAIMRATCDDHTKILQAIQQRKGRQAQAAMRQHIVAGLNLTLNTIESSRSRRWEKP